MIKFRHKGNFKKTDAFFRRIETKSYQSGVEELAQIGVDALRANTPVESGKTASSWFYTITRSIDRLVIEWDNSNVNDHVNIALILQLGHGTGTGGYFQGIDYINPSLRTVFDQIAEKVWKEVTR